MALEACDFLSLVKTRQSVRAYLPDAVDPEAIERCVEAARLAPSACNGQPWTYIIVDDPTLKPQLAALTADRALPLNHFTNQAPVLIVVVIEQTNLSARFGGLVKKRPLSWIDMAMSVEHFCLQAAAEGLGTCILGWFKEKAIKKLLCIPRSKRLGLLITLGHPAKSTIRTKQRKNIQNMMCRNQYTETDV